MNISYTWLSEYIDPIPPADVVAGLLTACGLEVESIEKIPAGGGFFNGVVCGKVLDVQPHPGADRLRLTRVDVGGENSLAIVCGAPNVAAGQSVFVATIGSKIKSISNQILEIKKSKIRGEVSEGMICAEDELGLGSSHEGILVLPEHTIPGTPAAEYLGLRDELIFSIGLTPNRGDAASHVGVARDLVAVLHASGKTDVVFKEPIPKEHLSEEPCPLPITIEDADCYRYTGALISGVQVGESPSWLAERLASVGIKSINTVVDITNYILMEYGQPLHAFDYAKIDGHKIIVRKAKAAETITTLDRQERKLDETDLLIAGEKQGMCIAGVFGGLDSGVTTSTTSVFIESACFSPVSIRKTSKRHGLKTEASFRYERGTDVSVTRSALLRAIELIIGCCGGKVEGGISDTITGSFIKKQILFRYKSMHRVTGVVLNRQQIREILLDLGFGIEEETNDSMQLHVPFNKTDVTREADVIEEILRIYGYDNIPLPGNSLIPLHQDLHEHDESFGNKNLRFFLSAGFTECMNTSFTSSRYEAWSGIDPERHIRLSNPLSSELDILRPSLVFGLLQSAVYNQNRQRTDMLLYESGQIYTKDDSGKRVESHRTGLLIAGKVFAENWNHPNQGADFFVLKSALENWFRKNRLEYRTEPLSEHAFLSEGLRFISPDKKTLAIAGSVRSGLKNLLGFEIDAWYAESDTDLIRTLSGTKRFKIQPLSRFPEVRRDLSLLADQGVTYESLIQTAHRAEKKILQRIFLFDEYTGKGIPEGKKSYALGFILQDREGTLQEQQIESGMKRIYEALHKELGVTIRV